MINFILLILTSVYFGGAFFTFSGLYTSGTRWLKWDYVGMIYCSAIWPIIVSQLLINRFKIK